MDTILEVGNNTEVYIANAFEPEIRAIEEYSESDISLWVKDGEFFKPSTNLSILNKLEPAIYSVGFNKTDGYFCQKTSITSDELFKFRGSIVNDIVMEIESFWDKSNLYKEKNLVHKRGIFLEGYPGTGKTSIITQISELVINKGGVVFTVNGIRNLEEYIEFITGAFRKIQPDTLLVTVLEDIDKYLDLEADLLDFLDGKSKINHHIVIATSNNIEEIPDTLLRPSRFDIRLEIPLPSEDVRKEYFINKLVPESDLEYLVSNSSGCSIADLKEIYICAYIFGYSIEESISKIKTPKGKKNYFVRTNKKVGFNIN